MKKTIYPQVLAKCANRNNIALITTAGLHFRDDKAFEFADATFRVIPVDENTNNLVMSHSSANFDRSGFQEDVNLIFPIDRFKELVAAYSPSRGTPEGCPSLVGP